MNADALARDERRPWWRGRWGAFALFLFVVQVAAIWLVSGNPIAPAPRPAVYRRAFLATSRDQPDQAAWRWLFTPAIFLSPSPDDFSGPAWLRTTPLQVEVEAFAVPDRALPWEPIRGIGATPPLALRLDPSPGGQWDIPSAAGPVPPVSLVPLPRQGTLRLLAGLTGRNLRNAETLAADLSPPTGAEPGPVRPVVVRVAVDDAGEFVEPPVVWESSEVGAYDEAAARVVRALRFSPGKAGIDWGLVRVEWPVRAGSGSDPREAMRPDIVLFLYLFLLLGGVLTLWLIRAFSRRRFRPGPAEDRVFRCSQCGSVYTDDPDVDLSRCPQCGLMNGSFDFRS